MCLLNVAVAYVCGAKVAGFNMITSYCCNLVTLWTVIICCKLLVTKNVASYITSHCTLKVYS